MRHVLPLLVSALALGGCVDTGVPIALRTSKGVTLRGTVTGSIQNAAFVVSNGKLTCTGSYPYYEAKLITVSLRCSDGHTGIALVKRRSVLYGGGTVRFSDGSEGTFVFGEGAAKGELGRKELPAAAYSSFAELMSSTPIARPPSSRSR